MARILSIEDDRDIQELIRYNLQQAGHTVILTDNGREGLRLVREKNPDIILLDIMLPGIGLNGFEICRMVRLEKPSADIPIIILTARSEESDIVGGLEAGADDYFTKPFSPRVLIARVQSVLRRSQKNLKSTDTPFSIHNITINRQMYSVLRGGEKLELSITEFAILEFLARNPGWVFSRKQIIDAIKGSDYSVTERSIDVQIFGLRKKLREDSALIETVRSIGYRFRSE